MTTETAADTKAAKTTFKYRTRHDHKNRKLVDVALASTAEPYYEAWVHRDIGTLVEEEGKGFRRYGGWDRETYYATKAEGARALYESLKKAIAAEKRNTDLKLPLNESKAGKDWTGYYAAAWARATDGYHGARDAFLKRAAESPADAISWEAAKVARAEYLYKLVAEFDRALSAIACAAAEKPTSKEALEIIRGSIQARHDERLSSFLAREPWREAGNLIDTALRGQEAAAEREFVREFLKDLIQTLDYLLGDRG